jgi:hypothetical protein
VDRKGRCQTSLKTSANFIRIFDNLLNDHNLPRAGTARKADQRGTSHDQPEERTHANSVDAKEKRQLQVFAYQTATQAPRSKLGRDSLASPA